MANAPFPDQLEAAANDIDTLSKQQIQVLLRRAAIRLREQSKVLATVRAEIAALMDELPDKE